MKTLRVPLFGALIAVLLTLVFVFLLYRPRVEEQAALTQETLDLQAEQLSVQAQIAELERIRDDEQSYLDRLDRLESLIPSEVAQAEVLRELQVAADAAGLEILSLTFSDPVAVDPPMVVDAEQQLGRVDLTLVLEGGYFQQVDFLRRLEQESARAVLVNSVAATEAEDGFPNLATTVTGAIFALIPAEPDPAATPAPGEAAPANTTTPATNTEAVS